MPICATSNWRQHRPQHQALRSGAEPGFAVRRTSMPAGAPARNRDAADVDLDSAREQIALRIAGFTSMCCASDNPRSTATCWWATTARLRDQIEGRARRPGRTSRSSRPGMGNLIPGGNAPRSARGGSGPAPNIDSPSITGLAPRPATLPGFAGPLRWDQQTLLDAARRRKPGSSRRPCDGQGPTEGHRRGTGGNLMPRHRSRTEQAPLRVDPWSVTPSIRPSYRCCRSGTLGGAGSSRVSEAAQRAEQQAAADSAMLDVDTRRPPVQRTRTAAPDPAAADERIEASHRLVDAYALQFVRDGARSRTWPGAHVDRFNARTATCSTTACAIPLEAGLLISPANCEARWPATTGRPHFESVARAAGPHHAPAGRRPPQASNRPPAKGVRQHGISMAQPWSRAGLRRGPRATSHATARTTCRTSDRRGRAAPTMGT